MKENKRTPRVKPLEVAKFLARRTRTFQGARQLAKAPNSAGKLRRWQHCLHVQQKLFETITQVTPAALQ